MTSPEAAGRQRVVLTIVLVSFFMIILDNSIVFTGLPRIREDLSLTDASLTWVQTAYAVPFGGFLLIGSRAGDYFGRRRMFVIGLAVFAAASLAVGASPSAGFMIGARIVQGLGAAILAPSTLTLLTSSLPAGPARTRGMAAYGAVAGVGASAGLVLGGVLADTLSWRVGFLVNVPIAVLAITGAYRYIPETRGARGRLDVLGAVTATFGMTAVVLGITTASESGWTNTLPVGTMIVGVAALVLFVNLERRVPNPMLPLRLFGDLYRSSAYVSRILFIGAMFGFFFFTTQYLQGELGLSALETGFAFVPMTGATFLLSLAVPRLTRAIGNIGLICAGSLVGSAGMLLLSRLAIDQGFAVAVVVPMLVIGVGQGLALGPLTAGGVAGVPTADEGVASGVVNSAHQLGISLGTVTVAAVAATAVAAGDISELQAQSRAALVCCGALMGTALVVSLAARSIAQARLSG